MKLTMTQAREVARLIGQIEACDDLMRSSAPGLGATLVSGYSDLSIPLPEAAMALLRPVIAATRKSAVEDLAVAGIEVGCHDTRDEASSTSDDLRVTAVRIRDGAPPCFELEIDGEPRMLRLTAYELSSAKMFRQRFLETFHHTCCVPTGRDADGVWTRMVDTWMESAEWMEREEAVDDTGRQLYDDVVKAARAVLEKLEIGNDIVDLERGMAIRHPENPDRLIMGMMVMTRRLREASPRCMGEALRDLGCTSSRVRIDGQHMRVWVLPKELCPAAQEESTP